MALPNWCQNKRDRHQDFKIQCHNGEIQVHKIFLASKSDFFYNLFFYEPSKSTWTIPDFLPQNKHHIEQVLKYVYSSSLCPINEISTLLGVSVLSDYLLLPNLREYCSSQLEVLYDIHDINKSLYQWWHITWQLIAFKTLDGILNTIIMAFSFH